MTRGERVIAFIEHFLKVPEGDKVGSPIRLAEFQKKFIRDIYDNPDGTSEAYLSIARKNGKTALIAGIALAHIAGPEAIQNSQIISGAQSRDQAAQVFNYAVKMVMQSPELAKLVRVTPSQKMLTGLARNVTYKAIAADAKTAHGLSPVLAILDEVGQVRGPEDAFIESVVTSQGAYDDALRISISTQAATDGDLFSRWLDAAKDGSNPHIVCHLYAADDEADVTDERAWRAANPGLGLFRSEKELRREAEKAAKDPHMENSFRWLYLNQRISAQSPFVSKSTWMKNAAAPESFAGRMVWGGLDLAQRNDTTALVWVADGEKIDVLPHFWLPEANIDERTKRERVPYAQWAKDGDLHLSQGATVSYLDVAHEIMRAIREWDVRSIAFDPHMSEALWPSLEALGMSVEDREALFHKVPQTYGGMSPCIGELEALLLNEKVRHGGHPVLGNHAHNAVLHRGPVTDQFLLKKPQNADNARIDGMVALSMAVGRRAMMLDEPVLVSPWDDPEYKFKVA